jgi:hypothetical protein
MMMSVRLPRRGTIRVTTKSVPSHCHTSGLSSSYSSAVVLWNEDPCERVSRGVVVCTYWYANSQGGWWERRPQVRETLNAYWLTDIYVKSIP